MLTTSLGQRRAGPAAEIAAGVGSARAQAPGRGIAAAARAWGRVVLTDLRLAGASIDLEAEGDTVNIHRMPEDWQLLSCPA